MLRKLFHIHVFRQDSTHRTPPMTISSIVGEFKTVEIPSRLWSIEQCRCGAVRTLEVRE